MTTAAPSTALATIQPASTHAERLALAGFLAGYRGLTRDAYALDLRQFSTWCRARSLALFSVRRADIESFARDLDARGRAGGCGGCGAVAGGGRPWGGCGTHGATFAGAVSRGVNGPGAAWLRGDGCLARL